MSDFSLCTRRPYSGPTCLNGPIVLLIGQFEVVAGTLYPNENVRLRALPSSSRETTLFPRNVLMPAAFLRGTYKNMRQSTAWWFLLWKQALALSASVDISRPLRIEDNHPHPQPNNGWPVSSVMISIRTRLYVISITHHAVISFTCVSLLSR